MIRRIRLVAFLFAACLIITVATQVSAATEMTHQDAQDIFEAGNAFYQAGQFEEAAQAYREILDAGHASAPVYYNLGTAESRVGSSTLALAHLVKAQKLDPRNDDVQANLRFTIDTVQQGRGPAPQIATRISETSPWERIHSWLRAEEWLIMLWVSLMIAAAGLSVAILSRKSQFITAGKTAAVVAGAIALLILIPAAAQTYATRYKREAVVIAPARMLSGPAERFAQVQNLAEGQMVRLLKHQENDYIRVQSPDGRIGYIRQTHLVEL